MKLPRPIPACFFAVLSLFFAASRASAAADSHSHEHAATSVAVAPGVTGLTATAAHTDDPKLEERARDWMRGLSPGWMPNRGQVAGPNGRTAGQVLYSFRTGGAQVLVTPRGLSAFFLEEKEAKEASQRDQDREGRELEWSALEIDLVGATIRPENAVTGRRLEELGTQHFYAPHCPDGVLGVPSYERITIRDVYPGIDWVLIAGGAPAAGGSGPMHQDFIVHPGADPSRIRLRYRGARDLRLDATGRTLRMRTALGEVSEGPLVCTQRGGAVTVPARLRLMGELLSVKLGAWDRSAPLTIDPPLLWSTLYGGENYDGPKSIYCDNRNGDVYVVGYTASSFLPCTTSVAVVGQWAQGFSNAPDDAFIWKFSQAGVRKWATYYGGNAGESAADCTVDRLGNLYVTGGTNSTNFPFKYLAGAYIDSVKSVASDAFLLKFNSQGIRQWATFYGGDGNDFAYSVAIDSSDRVYVVGSSASTNLQLANPGGAYTQALNGSSDNFILRFGPLGNLQWATYHGGNSGEAALGVTANGTDVYVTGETFSTVFPTVDPPGNADYFQAASGGGLNDAFISRFDMNGVQTWSTFYGGSGNLDQIRRAAIAPSGDVYMVGLTNSTDLPVFNPNPVATPNQPAYFQGAIADTTSFDLMVLQFSPANVRQWATYLGGPGAEDLGRGSRAITVDSQGRVTITGAASAGFPTVDPGGGAYFQGTTTNGEAIYARFSPADSLIWSTYYGGQGASFGTAVTTGVADCLFGTGEFQGTGFNTTPVNPGLGAWVRANNSGGDDGFITRFCQKASSCCLEQGCVPVATQAECAALAGNAFHLNQTCAQVVCTNLCNVCGRKFSDLNRNGVQDGGEPGLAGWTVELRDLANNIVATQVTDANGDYCFDLVVCGNYLVTEAAQNGWVKVAPPGPGHSVSLPLASTTNGIDFANYACTPTPGCYPMPQGLSAWWPFDDGPGATQAGDVTHASVGRNRLILVGGSFGDGSMCVASPAQYGKVPATQQAGLDFGTGSFGVSVWVKPDNSGAHGRVIVEKRGPDAFGGLSGWALQLDGMQCMLSLATGSAPQLVGGPVLPAGTWSQVVVSVDRATGAGRWYLNGSPVAAANFTPVAGSLDNGGDLFVGQTDPSYGVSGPGLQGCLAQLAIFHTPVGPEVAAKAWNPGPGGTPTPWCPEYAVLPASKTICATQNSVQVCFAFGNYTAAPVTYAWSLAGLAANPPGCTDAGPTQFSPSTGTITVLSGQTSPSICVTITRPNGFTQQGATACYELTYTNLATGVCRTRTSKLKVDNSCWCATTSSSPVTMVPAIGGVIPFAIKRPCDPIGWQSLRVIPRDPVTGLPDGTTVSLEGAKPGQPLVTQVQAGGASEATLPVHVYFPNGYDAAAIHELVLEADTDGDGTYEALASTFVAPEATTGAVTTGVMGEFRVPKTGILSSPNPFIAGTSLAFTLAQAEPVSLEVYDFSGRLVRSLIRGWLEAGPRRVEWDGRDNGGRRMAPGVYFARLKTRAGTHEARLVKVQ